MTQEKNTTSFLQYLQTVAPFLSSDIKKEALALVSLFEAFGVGCTGAAVSGTSATGHASHHQG